VVVLALVLLLAAAIGALGLLLTCTAGLQAERKTRAMIAIKAGKVDIFFIF
jgi:hypothetical protein